jgi:hypothetical protein
MQMLCRLGNDWGERSSDPEAVPDPRFAGLPLCGAPRAMLWGATTLRSLHRSAGYGLRLAPHDHPDFIRNALSEDLLSASLAPPSVTDPAI